MNDPNYYNRDVFSGPGVNVEDRDVETTESVDDTADGSVVATEAETEPRIGDEDVTDQEEAAAQAAQLDADIADEDRLDAEASAADDEDDSDDDDDEDAEDGDRDDSLDAEDSLEEDDEDDDEDDDLDGDIVAEGDEDDDDEDDADEADADAVATLDEDDDLEDDDDEAVAETDGEVVALDSDDSEDDDEDDADEDDEDDDDALAESDDEIVAADEAAVVDQDEDDDDTADEAAGNDASVVGMVPMPMPIAVDEVSVPEPVVDETAPMIPAQPTPTDGVPAIVSGGMHPGDADTMLETATSVGSSDLNDRMQQAQLNFIDDPRGATEAARTLANEAIEAQIAALRASTGQLDSWSGEEAPDTEVLRAAMRAYRDVITKLSAE